MDQADQHRHVRRLGRHQAEQRFARARGRASCGRPGPGSRRGSAASPHRPQTRSTGPAAARCRRVPGPRRWPRPAWPAPASRPAGRAEGLLELGLDLVAPDAALMPAPRRLRCGCFCTRAGGLACAFGRRVLGSRIAGGLGHLGAGGLGVDGERAALVGHDGGSVRRKSALYRLRLWSGLKPGHAGAAAAGPCSALRQTSIMNP